MSKHTPGPWHYAECQMGTPFVDTESVGDLLAAALPLDEEKANARLIAAAPDLLAALEDMIGHCQGCNGKGRCYGPVPGSPGSYASNQPCQDCSDARAAIAKAKGAKR
jgi:hypothetical protein